MSDAPQPRRDRVGARRLSLAELPVIAQFTIATSLFAGWVWIENYVIEPLGIWRFMPFYRYGRFCPWDIAAAVVILAMFVRSARARHAAHD